MSDPAAPGALLATPQPTGRRPLSVRQLADAAFDFSPALKALDTDGDGTLSEAELAAYRARKQARGEFIPAAGPPPHRPSMAERLVQAQVNALRDQR